MADMMSVEEYNVDAEEYEKKRKRLAMRGVLWRVL